MLNNQRRPNRRDKQQSAGRKAIGVLVGLFVVVAVIGYFYISIYANARPIDEKTLCPTDAKGPNSVTVVLIDRTDPFNITQQTALRDRLNDIREHTSKFDLLEVYSVEPIETKLLTPIFSMCNPGRGEGINQWIGNPHLVEERWQTLFGTPLQHLFDNILEGETAQISPIMEDIQSVVVSRLGAHDLVNNKIPRRLIIISDLLQYVKGYSQYHALGSFDQFKASPYYQNVRSDLSGVSVEFWYVRRKKTLALQSDKHIDFWRDYILDQGGSLDKVWYVPGT